MNGSMTRILHELQTLKHHPINGISAGPRSGDLLNWDFVLEAPKDSYWKGGIFKGIITFPENYPERPPILKITTPITTHPNVFLGNGDTGKVCMSLLHEGKDSTQYESDYERWTPVNNITSVLLGLMSIFYSPNFESPANIDAAKLKRENEDAYLKACKMEAKASLDLL